MSGSAERFDGMSAEELDKVIKNYSQSPAELAIFGIKLVLNQRSNESAAAVTALMAALDAQPSSQANLQAIESACQLAQYEVSIVLADSSTVLADPEGVVGQEYAEQGMEFLLAKREALLLGQAPVADADK